MPNEDLLKEYADLKESALALEEHLNVLGTQILAALQKENVEKAQTDYGTFSIISVPRWSYSEAVKLRELDVKQCKEDERKEGVATQQATTSLRFQTNKE